MRFFPASMKLLHISRKASDDFRNLSRIKLKGKNAAVIQNENKLNIQK